ncbi:unnamed protein product [Adineta steineri]|uniref:Uncharacterized protein n=1 Tax=Adineta steineri TaxID=433720 RepID=A0A813R1M7_9BILA|nr:unnamed protein product [Adineta steineri]CAF0907176.1 unnamed protein product [Adineta steineri]CAF1116972.1 unnamed protein product [Adineta steineri]
MLKCYIDLLCRLCYTVQTIDGHCCTVAEGVLDPSLVELFSSIIEETTVMNSVRTQAQQASLTDTKAVAWEFFLLIIILIVYPIGKQPFQDCKKLPHINNHIFTKFVERFVKQINEKSSNVHENHCDVQRLLEQIQYQHKTSIKLEKE